MSSRLWTSGYDIFYPTTGVISHEYGLRKKEKRNTNLKDQKETDANHNGSIVFWEDEIEYSLMGEYDLYTPMHLMILDRIKFLLRYPEAARDMITPKSLLVGIESYGLGSLRSLDGYMEFVGLDVATKVSHSRECSDK